MTDDRKIEDAFVVVVDGKAMTVRFSRNVATAEAAARRGKVRPAKLIWKDVDLPPVDPNAAIPVAPEFTDPQAVTPNF